MGTYRAVDQLGCLFIRFDFHANHEHSRVFGDPTEFSLKHLRQSEPVFVRILQIHFLEILLGTLAQNLEGENKPRR